MKLGCYMTEIDVNRFKSYMAGAGYNITTLATAIGMKRENLSNRINGKIDFSRSEMTKISVTLHVLPQDIFFDD